MVVSDPPGYYLHQHKDGQLVVHKGYPQMDEGKLWLSPFIGDDTGNYFSTLQDDGILITKEGNETNPGPFVWKTNTNGDNGLYSFGYDIVLNEIVIFEGTMYNRGAKLWSEPANFQPVKEVPPGPTVASSTFPSNSPSTVPSLSPSMSPTVIPSQIPSHPPSFSSSSTPSLTPTATDTISGSLPVCNYFYSSWSTTLVMVTIYYML